MIKRFRSERFTFSVKVDAYHSKMLQIIFSKRDGSVFVNFPYSFYSDGTANIATWENNMSSPGKVNLLEDAKATSYLVKYSHHPDGRVNFSQDGKVFTIIKKQSVPLRELQGHLFTTNFQGPGQFEKVTEKDLRQLNNKKTTLTFKFSESSPAGFKIVGRWYSDEHLAARAGDNVEGPKVVGQTSEGQQIKGFIISAPSEYPLSNYALFVTCQEIQKLDNRESSLLFIGGFDSELVIRSTGVTTFLALNYPVINSEELKGKIGSMDFPKPAKKK